MKRHKRDLPLMSQINITNMLDTALTLLLALMIVAPALKHGLDISLPEVTAGPLVKSTPLTITVRKTAPTDTTDRIYLEDKQVSLDELRDRLESAYLKDKQVAVIVETDKEVRVEQFLRVVAVVREVGIDNIGIPTTPAPTDRQKADE